MICKISKLYSKDSLPIYRCSTSGQSSILGEAEELKHTLLHIYMYIYVHMNIYRYAYMYIYFLKFIIFIFHSVTLSQTKL